MNRPLRILLGIGIIAILIPALALTAPGLFGGLLVDSPTASDAPPAERAPSNAVDADANDSPTEDAPTSAEKATTSDDADCESLICTMAASDDFQAVAASAPDPAGEESDVTTTSADTSTTADSDSEPASSNNQGQNQGTASKPSTTAASEKAGSSGGSSSATTSPPKSAQADGVISGAACPCTVTGAVELKGNVSLQGDLVVRGGTLIARPGVNVEGNGHQILFEAGGKADFQGSKTSTWSGNGSNANLSRDINFRNVSRIMFHSGAGKSTLKYFRISKAGVSEKVGFYPLHFHLNGNSTRGTLVEGVVIDNSANHAFVPHGSHGITFRDTIAKNIIREAYWWDPGASNATHNTLYDHVLADNVDYPLSLGNRGVHHTMAGFFLGRGNGNVVRNSVARNVDGGQNCAGFHWPEDEIGVWTFSNNAAYGSECNGIFIWQNSGHNHVINGFRGAAIDHGAYVNRYQFRNLDVNGVEVHALGASGDSPIYDGGKLGQVTIKPHSLEGGPVIFRNVTIGSFTIDNGGGKPGTYKLNNTNLNCGSIKYKSVVAGTKVIVDGKTC